MTLCATVNVGSLILCIVVSNWSWDNVDYSHLILWSVFGLVLVLVMGLKPLLLWPKSPLIARFNDPSISIQQCL